MPAVSVRARTGAVAGVRAEPRLPGPPCDCRARGSCTSSFPRPSTLHPPYPCKRAGRTRHRPVSPSAFLSRAMYPAGRSHGFSLSLRHRASGALTGSLRGSGRFPAAGPGRDGLVDRRVTGRVMGRFAKTALPPGSGASSRAYRGVPSVQGGYGARCARRLERAVRIGVKWVYDRTGKVKEPGMVTHPRGPHIDPASKFLLVIEVVTTRTFLIERLRREV